MNQKIKNESKTKNERVFEKYASIKLDFAGLDTSWVPSSSRIVVVGAGTKGNGIISIFQLDGANDIKKIKESQKSHCIKCSTFNQSNVFQRQLATGDFDGNLSIWDLEAFDIPVFQSRGHKGIINDISGIGIMGAKSGSPEIVTGGRDGLVLVWDIRQSTPVAKIENPKGVVDCWAVEFGGSSNENERLVCAGYENGQVIMTDLRTMKTYWESNVGNGVTSICFNDQYNNINESALIISTTANLHLFSNLNGQTVSHIESKCFNSTVWKAKFLPTTNYISSVDGDSRITLWKNSCNLEYVGDFLLGGSAISNFDWHPNKRGLAVCTSFDQTLNVVFTPNAED